mmetsp:Transcript_89715/g.159444  ORF Transcript_89715/g.159444 Transcript_89715/m.159444 type:complete len:80 (-) Transcript_89715:274-513(-)
MHGPGTSVNIAQRRVAHHVDLKIYLNEWIGDPEEDAVYAQGNCLKEVKPVQARLLVPGSHQAQQMHAEADHGCQYRQQI